MVPQMELYTGHYLKLQETGVSKITLLDQQHLERSIFDIYLT